VLLSSNNQPERFASAITSNLRHAAVRKELYARDETCILAISSDHTWLKLRAYSNRVIGMSPRLENGCHFSKDKRNPWVASENGK